MKKSNLCMLLALALLVSMFSGLSLVAEAQEKHAPVSVSSDTSENIDVYFIDVTDSETPYTYFYDSTDQMNASAEDLSYPGMPQSESQGKEMNGHNYYLITLNVKSADRVMFNNGSGTFSTGATANHTAPLDYKADSAVPPETLGGNAFVVYSVKLENGVLKATKENDVFPAESKTVVKEATCTEKGKEAYIGLRTGAQGGETEIAALGHNWGAWSQTTAPTCTADGVKTRKCKRCSEKQTRAVDALGHDWGEWKQTTAPTCTKKGEETRKCSRCETKETRELAALGHDWGKASYKWAADNSTVTASRSCKNDSSHKETETVNTSYQVTREATTEAEGEGVYTASFSNKAFATQTKKVSIPKLLVNNPFVDVKQSDFFYNPVLWAVENKVTSGRNATHFAPQETVMRSEAMLFFWAAKGKPSYSTKKSPFKDVKKKDWFYGAVLWAVENKITSGTDATHFSPSRTCGRSEILQFLYAAMGKPGYTIINPYSDVKKKHWYYDGAIWAYEKGLEKGSNGKFKASTPCTRAYVVTYLYRFITGKELAK